MISRHFEGEKIADFDPRRKDKLIDKGIPMF